MKTLDLLRVLRPYQWTKSAFCAAGLIFSGKWSNPTEIAHAIFLMAIFSLASSAMYIVNDLVDCERDKLHPLKKFRPIASGAITATQARLLAVCLLVPVLASFFATPIAAYNCLLIYLGINIVYSLGAKHEALMDVGLIAVGFVLRLLAGVYAVNETPTTWITLCTFFLALFLGFSKRRAEMKETSQPNGNQQRPVLSKYNITFLDSSLNSSATMTILSYALFTVSSGKNPSLIITVPFVCFGILHYKTLVMVQEGAQEPDKIVLKDRKLQFCVLAWLLVYLWITHSNLRLFH